MNPMFFYFLVISLNASFLHFFNFIFYDMFLYIFKRIIKMVIFFLMIQFLIIYEGQLCINYYLCILFFQYHKKSQFYPLKLLNIIFHLLFIKINHLCIPNILFFGLEIINFFIIIYYFRS